MPAVTRRVGRLGRSFHREDLWITAVFVLHRVDMQFAEAAPERLVLVAIEVLVPEYQDLPVEPSVVDVLRLFVGQRLRQVDPYHLRADVRGERSDLERAVIGLDFASVELAGSGIEHA